MGYINRLNDEQIRELCEIYSPSFTDLAYHIRENYIDITLRDNEGIEDNYTFYDYTVNIVDWMASNESDYLKKYREKMLLWFGNDYAINYLMTSY